MSFHFIASENFSSLNKTNCLESRVSHPKRSRHADDNLKSYRSYHVLSICRTFWPSRHVVARTGCGPFASTSRCSQKTSARCFTRGLSRSWGPGVRGLNRVATPRKRHNNSNWVSHLLLCWVRYISQFRAKVISAV